MEQKDEDLIRELIGGDEQLLRCVEEHDKYEKALETLNSKVYLAPGEEIRRKDLQKRKLLCKEKIYDILNKHRTKIDL